MLKIEFSMKVNTTLSKIDNFEMDNYREYIKDLSNKIYEDTCNVPNKYTSISTKFFKNVYVNIYFSLDCDNYGFGTLSFEIFDDNNYATIDDWYNNIDNDTYLMENLLKYTNQYITELNSAITDKLPIDNDSYTELVYSCHKLYILFNPNDTKENKFPECVKFNIDTIDIINTDNIDVKEAT